MGSPISAGEKLTIEPRMGGVEQDEGKDIAEQRSKIGDHLDGTTAKALGEVDTDKTA